MKNKFFQTAAITMGLTIFTLPLAACNPGSNYNANPNPEGRVERQENTQFGSPVRYPNQNLNNTDRNTDLGNGKNNMGLNMRVPPAAPNTIQNAPNDMRQRSTNISNQIKNMPEIDKANVVVAGNTAVVACSPSRASRNVDATKNAVIAKVKQVDPTITNVVVTESADMMSRVNQIMNDVVNNKPLNQINQDFNQLVRQVAPAMS